MKRRLDFVDDMVIINRKEDKLLPVMDVPAPGYAAGIKMFSEYIKKKS